VGYACALADPADGDSAGELREPSSIIESVGGGALAKPAGETRTAEGKRHGCLPRRRRRFGSGKMEFTGVVLLVGGVLAPLWVVESCTRLRFCVARRRMCPWVINWKKAADMGPILWLHHAYNMLITWR